MFIFSMIAALIITVVGWYIAICALIFIRDGAKYNKTVPLADRDARQGEPESSVWLEIPVMLYCEILIILIDVCTRRLFFVMRKLGCSEDRAEATSMTVAVLIGIVMLFLHFFVGPWLIYRLLR